VSADDIEKTKAPLLEHLLELRMRLIRGLIALGIATAGCFAFADRIFNILLLPYERARGKANVELIFTAPHEFFFTQLKLALFGGLFISLPIIITEIWKFVAPGLYRHERRAARPFLIATPILFLLGAALVYFVIMPLALKFFLRFEQAGGTGEASIRLLPRVSEYLDLIMTLILAFGSCFELPVLLSLLGRAGIVTSEDLRRMRRYAILGLAVVVAIVTPPDLLSMMSLLVPVLLLYEISIWLVRAIERRRAADAAERTAEMAQGK
jgi:sec-independent protein translocase protein TatC